MISRKISVVLILILFISGCSTTTAPVLNESENKNAKKFLSLINDINSASPDTISSSFTADGNMGDKKFRVEGTIAFDKKGYYKMKIADYVFKSTVLEAYRELDRLYFYYPAENRLLVDDAGKIELSNYAGFKTDYKLLYTLLTGGIPVISKYTVYKCLHDEKENGYNLILENDEYFENIFFTDDVPVKFLFIHKISRDKSEIYLNSITKKDRSIFFKNYKIVIPEKNTSINLNFTKPQLNTAVQVNRLNQGKLPKQTEIVKIN